MVEVKFPVGVVSGVPVVTVPEEVDVTNAHRLRVALAKAAAGRPPALVVDMTRTRFCDSAGLRVLVTAHKQAQAAGGAVLLALPSTAILRVLAITGIDQVVSSFSSLDEAMAQAIEYADGQGRFLGLIRASARSCRCSAWTGSGGGRRPPGRTGTWRRSAA